MLALAKRFQRLSTHDEDITGSALFKQTFQQTCDGKTYADRLKAWRSGGWFFTYFAAFWDSVYEKLCASTGLTHLSGRGVRPREDCDASGDAEPLLAVAVQEPAAGDQP